MQRHLTLEERVEWLLDNSPIKYGIIAGLISNHTNTLRKLSVQDYLREMAKIDIKLSQLLDEYEVPSALPVTDSPQGEEQ